MKVLYIAAECKPFSKVGGVGDVAGELPPALKELGVEIEVATPLYSDRISGREGLRSQGLFSTVREGAREWRLEWLTAEHRSVPIHFLDSPEHFRGDVYIESPAERPYWDDAVKFSFFSEACLDLIAQRNPDVVHVNDWPLGYLLGRMAVKGLNQARVLTVHNVQYQGNFWEGLLQADSLMHQLLNDCGRVFRDPHADWHCVNALRLGLESADMVNTVSPSYAREMTQQPDVGRLFVGGCGLESICAGMYPEKLVGILNGFEYTSGVTDAAFQVALREKSEARAAISAGFTQPKNLLLGFVGRAVEQKFRLLYETLRGKSVVGRLLSIPGVNLAVVATGEQRYLKFLGGIPESRGGVRNFSVTLAYDQLRGGLISRGCDVFLMPSLFEPCGITQLESMSNATPPLVRRTGGLADTVVPHTSPSGTGFVFDGNTREDVLEALIGSVRDAVNMFAREPAAFRTLQRNSFGQRFVWAGSAQRYLDEVYKRAVAHSLARHA
jgi:starch synthase